MKGPQVGEIWHHSSAVPVAVRHCPKGVGLLVYDVVDIMANPLVAEREELQPVSYDDVVVFAMAWESAHTQENG